ncbi:MAG TPA: thiamine pyrophosphate-requiring protein, partial [Ramlibacter sp.]
MSETVSDQLVQRLRDWGVRRVFGYPGDGINGVMGALNRTGGAVEFVAAPHEELTAFMAGGHARFTGELGVCIATSGPGAIHLLNGLYDARADHQPVLAIVGQQARAVLGTDYQQEVDLGTLFKDVAREYVQVALVPEQVPHLVDRACRIALDQRTVTCLVLPHDVQDLPAAAATQGRHADVMTGRGTTARAQVPPENALRQAAEILNAGERVAMLVGAGALGARQEVVAVADRLGAGVATALLGKAVVPDSLAWVTGTMGMLGTQPSWEMMNACDTLLMVGSGFPYSEFLPRAGQARGVQVDIDGRRLGLRYAFELNLQGDSAATLRALLPLLRQKADTGWRDAIAANVSRWREVLEARAMNSADGVNPQRLFHELCPRLPDDVMIGCDTGTVTQWFATHVRLRAGMDVAISGGLSTMGPAIPYALAGKFAHPGRPAIALVGDGAMQMLGNSSLVTLARCWRGWRDPRFVVLVLNNGELNLVTWEMRASLGDPKFEASQDLPPFPYADYARLLGLEAVRVTKDEELAPAIERAMAADRPVLLEVVSDPNVPPLPPHVEPQQAKHFLRAMLRRDPE